MTGSGIIYKRPRFNDKGITRRIAGISKYEVLICIVIAGVLATILLERFLYYQEYAEKTVMESMVVNMRSAMRLRIATLMMQDRPGEIGGLLNENPISWLDTPPPNYLGVLNAGEQAARDKDGWYFDAGRKELIYQPRLHRFFQDPIISESQPVIRFRVTAKVMAGKNETGTSKQAEGLEIVTIGQYKWF